MSAVLVMMSITVSATLVVGLCTRWAARRRAEIEVYEARGYVASQAELGQRHQGRPAPLEPWTPEEREAYGHNELDRWIQATQTELNRLEWNSLNAATPGETVELRAWGRRDPIQTVRPAPTCSITKGGHCHLQGIRRDAKACPKACDLAEPTVTGERVFG